jgi:dGTPase
VQRLTTGPVWGEFGSSFGHGSEMVFAHGIPGGHLEVRRLDRRAREAEEARILSPGATRAEGAGRRRRPEEPDPWRTCFEKDRDRILHSAAFRRLAGKTQVFVAPRDHQRTRLTHALEVAQVAVAVARAVGLNASLAEAIALGHDCGHGPGGHAAEEAFSVFLPEGFDHAVWGADVVLAPLNLCEETLDGVRNHSWRRPKPSTPEGEVVSWADRIAYCAHDLEDAIEAGMISVADLPSELAAFGISRSDTLGYFIEALVAAISESGTVGMHAEPAELLAALRRFNEERIYQSPPSLEQRRAMVKMLRALVEYYAEDPMRLPPGARGQLGVPQDSLRHALRWVAGMTDRYACQVAKTELGWSARRLPMGMAGLGFALIGCLGDSSGMACSSVE